MPPLPDRLPRVLRDATLLRVVSRVGLAAPEQVAALIAGCTVPDVSTGEALRVRQRLEALSRRGLASRGTWYTWYRALRDHERSVYRLTPKGVDALTSATGSRGRALVAIREAAMPALSGWSDERAIWFGSYPRVRDERAFRARLTSIAREGLAERRTTRERRHITAYSLTAAGLAAAQEHDEQAGGQVAADLRDIAWASPTRAPRADQAVHHLLLVSAAATVVQASGGRFLLLRGDEDLRSEGRVGRQATGHLKLGSIPDGRLWLRRNGESDVRSFDLEVLIGKYTEAQIAEKYERLSPSTLFFGPTEEVCQRVQRSGRARPTLIF